MARTAEDIVRELFDRMERGDPECLDELVDPAFVNHAAGPQGRDGWKMVIGILEHDLGPFTATHHAFIGDGDQVAHHVTMNGTHNHSTMPLLAGIEPTGAPIAWTYIHIWRTDGERIVEHWACRDDLGLLAQLGAWPR